MTYSLRHSVKVFSFCVLTFCCGKTAFAQTVSIGPNQYAFQFSQQPDYGLFFNSSDAAYQFLNSAADPVFAFDANTGNLQTDLRFDQGSDYFVPNNRYAFRSAQSPNVGLFAGGGSIQFRNSAANPIFSINASNGRFQSDIAFEGENTVRVAPGNYAFRSSVSSTAGLEFGNEHFIFKGTEGNVLMRINATTGNTNLNATLIASEVISGDGNAEEWTEAYSWGNHADAGYIDTETDPKIGMLSGNQVPYWNGEQLVGGSIRQFQQHAVISGTPSLLIAPNNPYPSQLLVLNNPGPNGFFASEESSMALSKQGSVRGRLTTEDDHLSLNATDRLFIRAGAGSDPAVTIRENGRVGIGTSSPSDQLQVDAESGEDIFRARVDGVTRFRIHSNGGLSVGSNYASSVPQNGMRVRGRVGIGTSPSHKLSVDSDPGEGALRVQVDGATRLLVSSNEGVNVGTSQDHAPARALYVHNKILVNRTEDVPGYRLAVNGAAIMEEVKVQLTFSWPDYVFEDSYAPVPLDELGTYVQAHKHLPGIPAAAEIEENGGIELGEMQRLTVEKIEELTLYILELKGRCDALTEENDKLRDAVDLLLNEASEKSPE